MILILDDPGAMPSCSKPRKVPSKDLYTWELLGGFGLPGEEEEMGPTDIDYLTHFRQAQVTFGTTAFSLIRQERKDINTGSAHLDGPMRHPRPKGCEPDLMTVCVPSCGIN
jgi:hypothetical protein